MPTRRACDVCYKRKIQCLIKTRGDPCDWCGSQGLSCTFDRVIQKDPNKRTTSDIVQELSSRVEVLEEALQSVNASASASPWAPNALNTSFTLTASAQAPESLSLRARPPRTSVTPAPSPCKLSRCQIGNNWYFKGVGIFSMRGWQWVSDGAGQRVFLEKFEIFGNPVGVSSYIPTALPLPLRALPPEPTCRYLLGVFLKSKTSLIFPILDKSLAEETLARAYDVETPETPDPRHSASAEACLWTMLALISRSTEAQQFDSIPTSHACVEEARRLLYSTNGVVSLDSLQATLMLWTYQKMKGQCHEASITFSNACRMVCDLGGHLIQSGLALFPQHIPEFPDPVKFHVRRLFWLCYCSDKDASLRTGSPPLLGSDYCDLSMPKDYGDSSYSSWCRLSHYVHLARVRENACRLLCSPRAFKYTDGELISHVRQLDDELEEYRLSVEPRYRPRLSIPPDWTLSIPADAGAEDRTHIIKLQLDYLSTMINIHTMVRKCGDFERNLPDDLHSVVHSSADLSIEASRSIFFFLKTVVDFWKEDSVWVVSHYAPMAAMPLFVNILIHPVGNPADSDLQILSSVEGIARQIPTERLSSEEIDHIQDIGDFVMELVRLGHSAAWKVKKGEREWDLDIIHR